jgi:hypothetical protein
MSVRYVIFSKTLGVYLGNLVWSTKPESRGVAGAVTFVGQVQAEAYVESIPPAELFPDWQVVPVLPDLRGYLASPEACVKAGLVGWKHVPRTAGFKSEGLGI